MVFKVQIELTLLNRRLQQIKEKSKSKTKKQKFLRISVPNKRGRQNVVRADIFTASLTVFK
jgi:hypothetical protein